MKNMLRALGMALKYRWSLIFSITCSILVALTWGANIGAVYPLVEVTFDQRSMVDWVNGQVTEANDELTRLKTEIADLRARIPDASGEELARLRGDLRIRQIARNAHQRRADFFSAIAPTVEKFAPRTAYGTLVYVMVFVMVATVMRGLFLMGSMVSIARVGERTVLDLQNQFLRNTLNLDLASLGEQGTGDLAGRIRGETRAIGEAIVTLFGKTTREPLKMVACLIGAAVFNWRLLLFSVLICPLAAYVMVRLAKSIKRASRRALEESAALMNRLFQAITYIKVVKAHTMESHERSRFNTTARQVYRKSMKIAVYSSLFRINNEVLGVAMITVSCLAGGYLVLSGETHLFSIRMCDRAMSEGEMTSFFAFLVAASDPIRKLGDVFSSIQRGLAAADRVFPLIDRETRVSDSGQPLAPPTEPAAVKFDRVTFGYDSEEPVLRDVSFEIKPGEVLCVVGANGSGKSTLANLLPRFYDPQQGRILLDGQNLQEYRKRDLRRYFGYVTQQTMLFDESIEENIRYGSSGASMEAVIAAAKKAHAHGFIDRLEHGYSTEIGEHGGRLSGGQRQRIALARAILREPQLLILDEATSQIDPESEILMQNTLAEFIRDRSALIITHRLSTLALADRILVIERGRVAGFGTHDELMETCSAYQGLRHTDLRASA